MQKCLYTFSLQSWNQNGKARRREDEGERKRTSPNVLAVQPKFRLRDNIGHMIGHTWPAPGSVSKVLLKYHCTYLHIIVCGCFQATMAE